MLVAFQIQVLANFLASIERDPRIRTTHIAVFMAIYKCWLDAGCPKEIAIKGRLTMEVAKISSSATWHGAIRALAEYGYIVYRPSYNKMECSKVSLQH